MPSKSLLSARRLEVGASANAETFSGASLKKAKA
jgi:hypothetical protein